MATCQPGQTRQELFAPRMAWILDTDRAAGHPHPPVVIRPVYEKLPNPAADGDRSEQLSLPRQFAGNDFHHLLVPSLRPSR